MHIIAKYTYLTKVALFNMNTATLNGKGLDSVSQIFVSRWTWIEKDRYTLTEQSGRYVYSIYLQHTAI